MIFWLILHTILCISFGFALRGLIKMSPPKTTHDYIDWSKIPAGYDWVAVDGPNWVTDNKVWAYDCDINDSMIIRPSESWSTASGDGKVVDVSGAIIGPLPPWRESLRRRPK